MSTRTKHRFNDQAMATEFSVIIEAPFDSFTLARTVANEIFDEIKRLEGLLSWYREDSEISQLNRLRLGAEQRISPETFRCLKVATEAFQLTNGQFDVAYRSELMEQDDCPRTEFVALNSSTRTEFVALNSSIRTEFVAPLSTPAFSLLTRPLRVRSHCRKLSIDLGGIGKGFALDEVAQRLIDYDLPRSLLMANTSTLLALDPPYETAGWEAILEDNPPVNHELCSPKSHELCSWATKKYTFSRSAISCSGKSQRGEHIYDPKRKLFATTTQRCWAVASTAAIADALSTAAMITK